MLVRCINLVQFCTQVWLQSFSDITRWRKKFLVLMAKELPLGDAKNWVKSEQLLPHVESFSVQEPADDICSQEWAQVLTNIAWYMCLKGSYNVAVRKALAVRERTLGQHNRTLTSVSNLALVLQDQGKYDEAEKMNQLALKGREGAEEAAPSYADECDEPSVGTTGPGEVRRGREVEPASAGREGEGARGVAPIYA